MVCVCVIPVWAYSVEDIMQYHTANMWYVSQDIAPGDSFTYLICDNVRFGNHHCYNLRMDFHVKLASQNNDYWVAQAEISDLNNNTTDQHIFLINTDTLDITTDIIGSKVADSVSNTVFYLSKFAKPQSPKPLDVGNTWGIVPSTFDAGAKLIVVSHDTRVLQNGASMLTSVIQYRLFESSTFEVSQNIAFPISATVFNPYSSTAEPALLYTFELIDYTSDTITESTSLHDDTNPTITTNLE